MGVTTASGPHALGWIAEHGRFLRSVNARHLRRVLDRQPGQCTWCGGPVPRGCRTWCGDACVKEFHLRCSPSHIGRAIGRVSQDTMDRNSRPLSEQVTAWATPQANDSEKRGTVATTKGRQTCLSAQSQLSPIRGATTESSPARTAMPGVLDAAFSRWLQGFPPIWDEASPNYADWRSVQERIARAGSAGTVTPSCPVLPPSLSGCSLRPSA